MSLEFTQEEVESELADILSHGDRRDLAKITGLGESYLKRQFNPDDETPSCIFRALQVICGLDELNEEKGERFFQAIIKFRELSKKRKPGQVVSLSIETGKLNKEIADFVNAKLAGLPFDRQFSELLEAESQLAIVKEQLTKEYNRLKEESPNAKVLNINFGGK